MKERDIQFAIEEVKNCFYKDTKKGGEIGTFVLAKLIVVSINKGGTKKFKIFTRQHEGDVRGVGYKYLVENEVDKYRQKLNDYAFNWKKEGLNQKRLLIISDTCTALKRFVEDPTYLQDYNYVYSNISINVIKLKNSINKLERLLLNYKERELHIMPKYNSNTDIHFISNEEIYNIIEEKSSEFFEGEIDKESILKQFPTFSVIKGDVIFIELECPVPEDKDLVEIIGMIIVQQPSENEFSTYTVGIIDVNWSNDINFELVEKEKFPLYIQNMLYEYGVEYITGKNAENLLGILN